MVRLVISLALAVSAAMHPLATGWGSFAPAGPGTPAIAVGEPWLAVNNPTVANLRDLSGPAVGPTERSAADSSALQADSAAHAYLAARSRQYFLGTLYELLLLLGLLVLRLGPRYRAWSARVVARPWVTAGLYVPAVLCTVAILSAPIDAWNHALALHFARSPAGWLAWTVHWGQARAVDILVAVLVALLLYPIMRRSRRAGWLLAWGLLVAAIVGPEFMQARTYELATKRLDPLQWRYPQLVADMERVARHAGDSIPPGDLVEAAFPVSLRGSGFAPEFAAASPMWVPDRIIFSGSLFNEASRSEILFVFGHEMGHLALHHSLREFLIEATILLALVYLAFHVGHWMVSRWGRRWGIESMAELTSLPLLLLLLAALNFVKVPAFNMTHRHYEHEADRYGLEAIHGMVPDPGAAAVGLFQLCAWGCGPYEDLDGVPGFWFRNHPTTDERIQFARTYDPWSPGRRPWYVVPRAMDPDSDRPAPR